MTKSEVISQIAAKYEAFAAMIENLSKEAYEYQYEEKWTAGQQIAHIISSIKPLVKAFGMPPEAIAATFGKVERANRSYEEMLKEYQEKLAEGGRAPVQYLPMPTPYAACIEQLDAYRSLVKALNSRIAGFSESELETLQIPHPLLGSLSLKEMLYNAIYHVVHHQKQATTHLANMNLV